MICIRWNTEILYLLAIVVSVTVNGNDRYRFEDKISYQFTFWHQTKNVMNFEPKTKLEHKGHLWVMIIPEG